MPEPNHQRLYLCQREDIPTGTSRGFDTAGNGQDSMFVVATEQGLFAYRNSCPHVPGSPMAWRKNAYLSTDGTEIVCFAHGARFDPETGMCAGGPCPGQRLTSVPLDIDTATGRVFAWITTR
ncbi:Rieske 2Fe-2S domain-containing protein [Marinobacter sp. NFXS9]|uniref:Rieske (2Fe-2S) protein n=1 Tax=Marinobacter sp. NFXS9 TaxID=2818433 RepID=UPI0032DECF05